MRRILVILAVALLFSQSYAFAEEVTFVKEYSYQASEADSKLSARAIALEQVKRLLLEELGTYLMSETEVKNFQLTKDKITTLSAGIVATQILEEKWNGETYYLKAKIKADPKEVTKAIDNLRNDMQNRQVLEESKKRTDEALTELARLRKELATIKGDKQKQEAYRSASNIIIADDWIDKGWKLHMEGDEHGAADAYNRALELYPQLDYGHYARGITYSNLGDHKRALADFNRVIELKPEEAYVYVLRGMEYIHLGDNERAILDFDRSISLGYEYSKTYVARGRAYSDLGDNKRAIADFNRAIELNPKEEFAYIWRGGAYSDLGDNKRAITEFDRAIELLPKYAMTYVQRGIAYSNLEDYKRAFADYNRAIELDPKEAGAYFYRGILYGHLGDDKRAVVDFDTTIDLNPKLYFPYAARGNAYIRLGNEKRAIADWKTAARLGDKVTQDFLKLQGIEW